MESPQYDEPSHFVDTSSSSRPSLGFPLGTALLLIVIFSLSGVFSCFYHWEKIRSLRRATSDLEAADDPASFKSKHTYRNEKQNQIQNMNAVLMPGDQVPKFIAMPCPCQPHRPEKVTAEVQKLPLPPPSPPKPPRMIVGVPFYS